MRLGCQPGFGVRAASPQAGRPGQQSVEDQVPEDDRPPGEVAPDHLPWRRASVLMAADDLAARVFGRALGARDIALGLGALTALQRPATEPGSACAWVAAGALSDALDVVASLSSWRELPRVSRWLVAGSAGGAALVGAAGALAVRPNRNGAST
jgi:hypothetical protein